MIRSEKFVKMHYPSARCVETDLTYLGKTTHWFVIYIDYGTQIDDLGASSKDAIHAWRSAAYWTKQRINTTFLKKLES